MCQLRDRQCRRNSDHDPLRYADLSDADQTVTVEVVAGAPVGGYQRVEADRGSVVALLVTVDTADELHVHGYDILRAVSDGNPAHFAFTAEIPGVFEVETARLRPPARAAGGLLNGDAGRG